MMSEAPLYDASVAIAQDIIAKGKEIKWSETELAGRLRQYVRKGMKKMQAEIEEKKGKRECLKTYVEHAVASMSSALSSREWFAEEDFGPLLAAGMEEVQPRPYWANRSGMKSVKDTIYEFYDEAAKCEDFDNALWNTIEHHISDGQQKKKAFSFFTRAFRKAEKDLEEGKIPSPERTTEKFCKTWASDSMWRIWQSEAAEVPVNMVVDLLFNMIKMKLLPAKLFNNFERGGPIQCQNALRKLLTALYAEANVDVRTGRHFPEPAHVGAKRARESQPAPQKRRPIDRDVDRRPKNHAVDLRPNNHAVDRRPKPVLLPKKKLESFVPAHLDSVEEEEIDEGIDGDMEETEFAEQDVVEEEYASDEGANWGPEEEAEEDEDAAEEEAYMEDSNEAANEAEVDEDHLEVEEDLVDNEEDQHDAQEDIEGEADEEELVCISVSTEVCVGSSTDRLVKEKNSGWIFCESCFFQLQEQQGVEYEGEYLTE